MTNGSDLLVAALENECVDRIFGIPGEENLDVVESLRRSKIELVLTRHEQAAAFMAATHGRLTGRARVCIARRGCDTRPRSFSPVMSRPQPSWRQRTDACPAEPVCASQRSDLARSTSR